MQSTVRLDAYENTREAEDKERSRFVRSILEQIKIPKKELKDIWDANGDLSIENKIKLRSILQNYNISIIEAPDGNIKVYHKQQIVAEWGQCNYVLKVDHRALDPKKRHYLEMTYVTSSIYEKNK